MIVDSHVHIGGKGGFYMPPEMLMQSLDKYNITYALVSSIDAVEMTAEHEYLPAEHQTSQEEVLRRTLDFVRANKDRCRALAWVKPYGEDISEEYDKMIADNRDLICGIKVHQFYSNVALDDEKMKKYIELARKYKLPIVAHTAESEESKVIHVYNAAKANPDVDFVMVHMGLGSDNNEAIELLEKLDNLYGDTTWVPIESTVRAVEKCGSRKILFGSDSPIDGVDTYHNNPSGELSVYQQYFNELENRVGFEAYENIMFRNAARIFRLHI